MKIIEVHSARRQSEKDGLVQEMVRLNEEMDQADDDLSEKANELEDLAYEIRALEFDLDKRKKGIIDTLNEKAQVGVNLQRYDSMLEQNGERTSQVAAQLTLLSGNLAASQKAAKEEEKNLEELKEKLAALTARETETAAALTAAEKEERRLQEEGTRAERALQQVSARYETLRNLAERYEGYGSSVRRVMEVRDRYPGIVGVVADLIESDKKYETAIETALGGSIQNVVTETESCAKELIAYLKVNKFGRVTFLPLESIRGSGEFRETGALREKGAIGLADSLVRVKEGCEGLARYLLGRVLVVDNIDHALAIARKYHYSVRMVTLEGELLSAGGSLTGGAFRNSSNLLGRKRELEELEAERGKAEKERKDARASLARAGAKAAEEKETLSALGEQTHALRLELNTAQLKMRQGEEKRQELSESRRDLLLEETQLKEEKERIEKSREELSQKSLGLEDRNRTTEGEIQAGSGELEALKVKHDALAQEQNALAVSFQALTQQNEFLMENMARLTREIASFRDEKKEIEAGVRLSQSSVKEKENQILSTRSTLEELEREKESLEAQAEALAQKRDAEAASQKAFVEKREALLEEVNRLDKEVYRLEAQLEKCAEQRESLMNYLWTEYELTPVAAREWRREGEEFENIATIRSRTQELKKQIKALGDVNVGAIEEYREVSERYEFLKAQHADLTEGKSALEGIIAELDDGMRRQFTEKFEEIRREFQVVFTELFGGGQATLSLVEGEDILTAGVQIIAQPPGKKLQNMMQLSGGEKALTAICLLFAIQNMKPSPFCLLDEIEAALDDSNVDRFAGYLGNLTDHTQFILITHRRGTMLRADRLYGITMQEKGVSTLVSVDLTDEGIDELNRSGKSEEKTQAPEAKAAG